MYALTTISVGKLVRHTVARPYKSKLLNPYYPVVGNNFPCWLHDVAYCKVTTFCEGCYVPRNLTRPQLTTNMNPHKQFCLKIQTLVPANINDLQYNISLPPRDDKKFQDHVFMIQVFELQIISGCPFNAKTSVCQCVGNSSDLEIMIHLWK